MIPPSVEITHDFEIDGISYKQKNIPALDAISIAFKLGGLIHHLPGIIRSYQSVKANLEEGGDFVSALMASDLETLAPFGKALNDISDQHRNQIIESVLKVTFRGIDGGYMPTWNIAENAPSASIGPVTIIKLVYRAFKAQIEPFTPALGSDTSGRAGA